MIKAVLFDMDGVLFDSERVYAKALFAIARELGYSMDMAFFVRTLGISSRECRKLYAEVYGEDFPYDRASAMLFQFIMDYHQNNAMPIKDGVLESLSALRGRGLPLVLATSSLRTVVDHLFASQPELGALFAGKVCGDEVTLGKPEPEIYQKAAALAGFAPADCLGVEDSPSGLMAIRASGAQSVMIPDMLPYSETLSPFVDHVLTTVRELPRLVDTVNGG